MVARVYTVYTIFIFLLPRSIHTHTMESLETTVLVVWNAMKLMEVRSLEIHQLGFGHKIGWTYLVSYYEIYPSKNYTIPFLFVVLKRTVFLRMFAFPLLLVRALRLGSLSCLLFLLFQWPPKPWHSDEHQGSRWMSIPLKCGIIGLISKSSASGSVCAQTVSPRFNVTCKCDLAPKTSHGKTKAAPPFTIHLHNACSLAHVERTSFWVDSHPWK